MAKAVSLFNFRQRVGKVDWKLLSSLNIEDIIVHWKIQDLQLVLDHVTFCEFLPKDIQNNTIDNIAKVIQIMQLIIEYLLNHQEIQLKQIHDITKKYQSCKYQRQKIEKSNHFLVEEVHAYQRQLHVLRKSLQSVGITPPVMPSGRIMAKVIDPFMKEEVDRRDRTENLLMALMDHEQKARLQTMQVLEDQRKVFAQEINNLITTFKDQQHSLVSMDSNKHNNNSNDNNEKMMTLFEGLKKQLEGQCQQLMLSVQQQQQQQMLFQQQQQQQHLMIQPQQPIIASGEASSSLLAKEAAIEKELTQLMRQQAALELQEREVKRREIAVTEREQELAAEQLAFSAKSRGQSQAKDLSQGSLALSQAMSQQKVIQTRKQAAVRMLYSTLRQAMRKRCGRSFRIWSQQVLQRRVSDDLAKHVRDLARQADEPSSREIVLQQRVSEEQRRYQVLESQFLQLNRDLNTAKDQVELLVKSQSIRNKQDSELSNQLRQEKERLVVMTAKYNSLAQRADKEKADLLTQLDAANEKLSKQGSVGLTTSFTKQPSSSRMDSSMMTSLDYPSSSLLKYLKQGVDTSIQASPMEEEHYTNQMLFEGDDLDEQALLSKALMRIGAKRTAMNAQQTAMATLAEELTSKLGVM